MSLTPFDDSDIGNVEAARPASVEQLPHPPIDPDRPPKVPVPRFAPSMNIH
jgi:hypothetical protein